MNPTAVQPSIHGAKVRLSAYPALLVFSGLATGIWLEYARTVHGSGIWMAIVCASGGAVVLSACWSSGRLISLARLSRYLAAALLATSAGGIRASQFAAVSPGDISLRLQASADEQLTLVGRTLGTPVVSNGRSRFILKVDSVASSGNASARAATGRVYVTVRDVTYTNWIDGARAGSRLAVSGSLREVPPPRNPADFDFRRFLEHRGVRALLRVDNPGAIRPLDPPRGVIQRVAVAVERSVEGTLQRRIPTETGRGILIALLLGRRSDMDPQVLDSFSRTGLLHILAVSGLHVLMVGMVVYGLLCPILLRFGLGWRMMELSRASVTLLLLTIYAVVTGGSASVTRAVVMTGVLIGGVAVQRSAPALNSLAVAGCVLLMQRPTYVWDVGFQLSFAAVAAIVLLQQTLMATVRERWDEGTWQANLAQGIATSTAATIGTAPVLVYHFGSVSVAGLVLNPVAIPASGLALAGGLMTVLTSSLPAASAAFGHSADFFSHVLVETATIGDHLLGWARVDVRLTYPPYVLGLVLTTCVLATLHEPRTRWRLSISAAFVIAAGVWMNALSDRALPTMEFVFLDVGQGDATLIRFPNGRVMAVDLGPRDSFFDAGTSVVVPHLERFDMERIDVVVVTHPHSDHLGGLPAVLRALPVSRLVHNGDSYDSELFEEAERLCDSLDIPEQVLGAGDTLSIDPLVRVRALAPSQWMLNESNPNERSIVLSLEFGETTALLAGDAERGAEDGMLADFRASLAADVVKVGHHGSDTSSQLRFVRAVTAHDDSTWAVVSVAERNRFGLPDDEPLDRWREAGARLHLTSGDGALWLRTDGRQLRVVRWRAE